MHTVPYLHLLYGTVQLSFHNEMKATVGKKIEFKTAELKNVNFQFIHSVAQLTLTACRSIRG